MKSRILLVPHITKCPCGNTSWTAGSRWDFENEVPMCKNCTDAYKKVHGSPGGSYLVNLLHRVDMGCGESLMITPTVTDVEWVEANL